LENKESLLTYFAIVAESGSAEIDNDILYEGHKTVKIATTNATGRVAFYINGATGASGVNILKIWNTNKSIN